jgi:hypothetical protein
MTVRRFFLNSHDRYLSANRETLLPASGGIAFNSAEFWQRRCLQRLQVNSLRTADVASYVSTSVFGLRPSTRQVA